MEVKPYYCPNCRSNRAKFSLIEQTRRQMLKDAMTGDIIEIDEPVTIEEPEPTIECKVCGFQGNELRFIRQAERDPRLPSQVETIT